MIKTIIIAVISFILGALLAGGFVWYQLIIVPLKTPVESVSNLKDAAMEVYESAGTAVKETVSSDTPTAPAGSAATPTLTEPMVINIETLPEAQQSVLESLGLGPEIVITPSMQTCAVAKIGQERLDEIVAGDTPGVMESVSLTTCLRQ